LPSRCWRVAPRAGSLPGSQPRNKRLSCAARPVCGTAKHPILFVPLHLDVVNVNLHVNAQRYLSVFPASAVCCHCPSSASGLSSAQSACSWCRFLPLHNLDLGPCISEPLPLPRTIHHPSSEDDIPPQPHSTAKIIESIPESHPKKPATELGKPVWNPTKCPPSTSRQPTNLEPSSPPSLHEQTSTPPACLRHP